MCTTEHIKRRIFITTYNSSKAFFCPFFLERKIPNRRNFIERKNINDCKYCWIRCDCWELTRTTKWKFKDEKKKQNNKISTECEGRWQESQRKSKALMMRRWRRIRRMLQQIYIFVRCHFIWIAQRRKSSHFFYIFNSSLLSVSRNE